MSTHQIVKDVDKLKEFIDWLPELGPDEVFFLCLQARKKYNPALKSSDKQQLKRFVATKLRLLDKIRQLECPVGSYQTSDGEPIQDESMVLYITVNPRDMRKATFASIKALVDVLQHPGKELNPHSAVLSEIHKAKSRSAYVHFDLDMPNGNETDQNAPKCTLSLVDVKEAVVSAVGPSAGEIVRTRGGCHVLIKPELVVSETKNWYPVLRKKLVCDQVGDLMVPVVGTNQAGFMPYFYK